MKTDDHGQPEQAENQNHRRPQDAEQTVSLSTQQAAAQLGVDSRTVRRYIHEGIRVAGGAVLRLEARQVRSQRGPEWQIYQTDLEAFKQERDRAATEGNAAGQLRSAEENQSQALATSIQIISAELERRSQALAEAQQTIERLALQAGHEAGRNQELERELADLRQRVTDLTQERNHWQQKARKTYRIRLFPIEE